MVFERGTANSPQTNGISERFNQTFLTKCQCFLAQYNVSIHFWVEAVKFSSTLINLLPSCSLNWKYPVSILLDLKSNIEPVRSLNSLIPFGLKAFVRQQSESKLLPPSKQLLYLGPEDYSDASGFLDPQTGKVINNITSTTPTIPDDQSPPTPVPSSEPTTIVNPETNQTPLEPCTTLSSPSCIPLPQKKGYTYVLHYHNSPKDINSNISRDNIITEPKVVAPPPADNGDLYLNEEVSVKQAFQDPNESKHWKEAMDKEFESLTSKNTCTMVPPLSTEKVIGGMWRLIQKKNEFGKILKYKAR
ncbi:hypothetical protein O181_009584 [Austropuccinia psidii MF-1]|uniref:Integrase catalytic domain-containing protein n=1 Tax=Austropuccinia psidii MF-1 TaxID=1389203 RepID=A0A9Q3GK03_9BASI|nr:hypothetical protein [Austropuccinia psidii MF-1]